MRDERRRAHRFRESRGRESAALTNGARDGQKLHCALRPSASSQCICVHTHTHTFRCCSNNYYTHLRYALVPPSLPFHSSSLFQTWIFDKIHHEINQFCSAHTLQEVYIDLFDTLDEALALALQKDCNVWAPGIEIIAVRVTKPKIPTMIARNFESIEIEKTKLHIATAHQAVVEKEAETERKRATIDAEMLAAISTISMRKELAIKQSEQKIASLHDEIHLAKEKVRADAEHYRGSRLAEVNKARLTKAFLEYTHIQAMGNNSKVYFGEKIPSMYVERDESGLVHQ